MPDTPDWQARVLARLTNTAPDQVDTTDPEAWLLAYATLNARHGETGPPEVLAELVHRVEGIDLSLDRMVKTNEMTVKAIGNQFNDIWDAFKHTREFHQKLVDSMTWKRRRPRSSTGE